MFTRHRQIHFAYDHVHRWGLRAASGLDRNDLSDTPYRGDFIYGVSDHLGDHAQRTYHYLCDLF